MANCERKDCPHRIGSCANEPGDALAREIKAVLAEIRQLRAAVVDTSGGPALRGHKVIAALTERSDRTVEQWVARRKPLNWIQRAGRQYALVESIARFRIEGRGQ